MAGSLMKWDNFTGSRVEAFKCVEGRQQSIYWDGKTPGLGLRVTAKGAKSYIFETTLNGKTLRMTIGDVRTWSLSQAQAKATAYKAQTDSGVDPRKVHADRLMAETAAELAKIHAEEVSTALTLRNSVTLADVWPEYIADRVASREGGWSEAHVYAHHQMMQAGGQPWKRGSKVTQPGTLYSLSKVRLIDLTADRIETWARAEVKSRPTSARLAWRLLKACINWCSQHATYSSMVPANATKSVRTREALGKPKTRNDVLQREMLAPWFSAVRKINSPVISAYLQILLLIGARREELAALKWDNVNFQWGSIKLDDKVEDFRMIPLTPYVSYLLSMLPRRNEFVFSSPAAATGYLAEPRHAHNDALAVAGLPDLTLHGLRRSFATLSEWVETPPGVAAQIQGHAPQGVREQNYIRRPLDLLRVWHVKIETWVLKQAGIDFDAAPADLRVVP
jgi:integrase